MSELKARDVRGTIHDDPESLDLMDHPDSTEEIPILDISPYLKGEPGGREAVAAHLGEISRTVGFFYLKGHGVPPDLLERVFAEAKRFHSLPEAEKKKIPFFEVGGFKPRKFAPPALFWGGGKRTCRRPPGSGRQQFSA